MLTLSDIQLAQGRIRGAAVRTPLVPYPRQTPGRNLFFKAEIFQPMGAFKLRGAYNAIASLTAEERLRGVVAHSSGNHAQAVAYAARALGVKAVVVMPHNAPQLKKDNTAGYGAEVVLVGNSGAERAAKADELARERGLVPIPPYDDERVMAGQGTLALEILEDLPDVGAVLVPVSGGGLISGVAAALKLSRPEIKVIGVEPELAADAQASLRAGHLVSVPAEQTAKTLADGLRVSQMGNLNWPHVQKYVDDILTVSEPEIKDAVRHLALTVHLVTEASGAVPFAAWLSHLDQLPVVENTVIVLSGGNIEAELLAKILAG